MRTKYATVNQESSALTESAKYGVVICAQYRMQLYLLCYGLFSKLFLRVELLPWPAWFGLMSVLNKTSLESVTMSVPFGSLAKAPAGCG
jgi:hypothetical protein